MTREAGLRSFRRRPRSYIKTMALRASSNGAPSVGQQPRYSTSATGDDQEQRTSTDAACGGEIWRCPPDLSDMLRELTNLPSTPRNYARDLIAGLLVGTPTSGSAHRRRWSTRGSPRERALHRPAAGKPELQGGRPAMRTMQSAARDILHGARGVPSWRVTRATSCPSHDKRWARRRISCARGAQAGCAAY